MDTRTLAGNIAAKHNTRDPFRIAEELGFIVVFAPLVEMRGFQQRSKRRNFIYINSSIDEPQQRLVCAHELGHHYCHRGMNRIFMDRNTAMIPGKYENEAHRFAVELLYADEDLQPFLPRPITDAAAYMGVPLPLAEYRMSTVEPTFFVHHFGC